MPGYCTQYGFQVVGMPILKPAYLGVGVSNYPGPGGGAVWQNNYITGVPLFLNNMWNRYSGNGGCNFLEQRLDVHSSHLQTGLAGPQSNKQMGSKWATQKEAKVNWYQCIIPKCCSGDVPSAQISVPHSTQLSN